MKNVIKTFVLIIFAMLVFAQNSNGQSLTAEEQAWILENPVVRVSNNSNYPPIDFVSAGQPSGFAVDYMRLVASKVGLKIDFLSDVVWKDTVQKLKDKEIDIVTIMSKNEERALFALFTSPYIYLPIVHYGRTGSNKINSIKDFEGKRIGLQSGHIVAKAYERLYPNLNYLYYDDSIAALSALTSSEIDIYTDDNVTIGYAISQYNIEGLVDITGELEFELNPLDQRFSVHIDNKILLDILNKGIAAVTDQEFKEAFDKWIKSDQVTQGFKFTSAELAWLAENKIIKVSAANNSFPFDFIDDEGRISGVSGNFLNEISKQLNVEFVWSENESWNDGLLKIQSGDADMVTLIAPTKERQSFLEFSDTYLNLENVIFSRDDSTVFSNMDALYGRTVVQLKGTAIIGYLKENYPNIKIIETETYEEALELLSSGGADALIENISGGLANISNFGFENLRIVGTTPYSEALTFGISSELPLLSSAIQKALTNISIETRSAIFTKWLTEQVEAKVDYRYLYYVIGLALFAGLIIILWNRKLNKDNERFRRTFENIATGVIVSDELGKIEIFNEAAEKMFGYTAQEVVGENLKILMPEHYSTHHDTYLSNHNSTGVKKIIGIGRDVSALRKNGEEFPIRLRVGKIKTKDKVSFIGSITDLTDITDTQVALQAALDEARDANAAKTNFLASMSHDLRTPLNAIIGFSETLLLETFGPIKNKKNVEYINDIHSSGEYLLHLVNDILDLSILGADKRKLNYENFEGEQLILECNSIIYKLAEDKNIDIAINNSEKLPNVYGDRNALKQILMNLISNAIKFTPPKGNITINSNISDDHYIFQIIDTGWGISEENIEVITKPFTKVVKSPLISHEEGSGLGLSIVKSLIDLHEGELNIESIIGEGTTITVSIPLPNAVK